MYTVVSPSNLNSPFNSMVHSSSLEMPILSLPNRPMTFSQDWSLNLPQQCIVHITCNKCAYKIHGPLLYPCLSDMHSIVPIIVFSLYQQSSKKTIHFSRFRPFFPIIDHLASASMAEDCNCRFQCLAKVNQIMQRVRPAVSHGKLKLRMSIDVVVKRFFYVYSECSGR